MNAPHLDNGKILRTRSPGKDVYYIPGGKREEGETDLDTLIREIDEELAIVPATVTHVGTFRAQAHGHAVGVTVQMTCYADRDQVSPVDQVIFDHLHQSGQLH